MRRNSPGRPALKASLVLTAVVACSLTGTVEARETRRLGIPRLNEDQLGEPSAGFGRFTRKQVVSGDRMKALTSAA